MTPKVAIIMGSKSDQEKMEKVTSMLEDLEIPYSVDIYSAHRTPNQLSELIKYINKTDEYKVVIAGAGMSAALPGVIKSQTNKPVIGLPLSGGNNTDDMAAILSVLEMPPGISVACVGLNAGKNAALLAADILAIQDADVAKKLADFREAQKNAVLNAEVSFEKEAFRCS